jgi:hypothetical protein
MSIILFVNFYLFKIIDTDCLLENLFVYRCVFCNIYFYYNIFNGRSVGIVRSRTKGHGVYNIFNIDCLLVNLFLMFKCVTL